MHTNELLLTFTTAAALGVCLFTLAHYLKVSAIVVLLIGGVIAGPSGLGIVKPETLGDGLGTIISLAVAVILFEGGLTLELKGYRSASKEILRILSVGVVVTWLGTCLLLRLLFAFDWAFCLLSASLIIVTGPTVIGPLLSRIRVRNKLHDILHWEGVLIDPIGVFVALMCFEYYVSTDGNHQLVVQDFLIRFVVGVVLGILFGLLLDFVLRREWIVQGHVNIFVLAMALLNFGLADLVIAESGLLSVTVAGLLLGSRKAPQLHDIVSYKVELKDFLIGLLFVLLAANLDLQSFLSFGWKLVAVVAVIMLLIRPVNVFLSTGKSSLSTREKLFLSWIAPRGIVAASMASVFALNLERDGADNASFLEAFTYSVIIGTVVIQGLSAGVVARLLGVVRPVPSGWIIVGSHAVGRAIAQFLAKHDVHVVLVDTNAREVRSAKLEGLHALSEDAMQLNPEAFPELYGCGNLLALTANPDLNRMLCRRWSELLEGTHLLRWEKAGYETAENQHLLVGTSVWTNLPLNRWMVPNASAPPLIVRGKLDAALSDTEHVLFSAAKSDLIVGHASASDVDDFQALLFDASDGQSHLGLPLDLEHVLFTTQTDLSAIYLEMLTQLQTQFPRLEPLRLRDEMWKREEDYTSLLGHGIALPHSWTDSVDQAVVMVARLINKVQCPLTGRDIDIVFMLLSPEGNPKEHLEHLSFIAHLIGSESRRTRVLEANTPEELHQVIVSG